MRQTFELRRGDAAGRVGELAVPRAGVTVETPALLPVVNPNVETVAPARLESEFGAQALITNSYIIRKTDGLRERALAEGLHDLFEFSGAIVTDSGSFQLAEYGSIDVTTREILEFQHDIGSDVGTPVDVPTPPDADRETTEADLDATETAIADAGTVDVGEMLVNAPVQGSTYPDLREAAGRRARASGLDVFPVGAVVPLMNAYRYADLVDVVMAAKRGLGPAAPVHLFGAGHPMTFALAVAAGCDLFDSAAYALYARDDRYLTVRGTEQLAALDYLPCSCPVCTDRDAATLRGLDDGERERELAAHNLHVSFEELRRVRQAVRAGDLLELLEARARAHPAMLAGYRALLDHAAELEAHDPASKDAFFYLSAESARRPEVERHRDRLARIDVAADVGTGDGSGDPATGSDGSTASTGPADPSAPQVLLTEGGTPSEGFDAVWNVVPPFGPFPPALSETYPLTAEVPERDPDPAACEAAARAVAALAAENPGVGFTLAHDGWPASALALVPESVAVEGVRGD
jgi:7-cyano-7-deazaguanine tRNA-ribosyltransferase